MINTKILNQLLKLDTIKQCQSFDIVEIELHTFNESLEDLEEWYNTYRKNPSDIHVSFIFKAIIENAEYIFKIGQTNHQEYVDYYLSEENEKKEGWENRINISPYFKIIRNDKVLVDNPNKRFWWYASFENKEQKIAVKLHEELLPFTKNIALSVRDCQTKIDKGLTAWKETVNELEEERDDLINKVADLEEERDRAEHERYQLEEERDDLKEQLEELP